MMEFKRSYEEACQLSNCADVKMNLGLIRYINNYYLCESQEKEDRKKGASWIPEWVKLARRRGERVRMHEYEYWINYTHRVPYNRKFTAVEWTQLKIFDLPKKTLKLQVEPEHLDVFLSTVKLIKPRKAYYMFIDVKIIDLEMGENIIQLTHIYGRFDDSNLNKDFEWKYKAKFSNFEYVELHFKNKYEIIVYKGRPRSIMNE